MSECMIIAIANAKGGIGKTTTAINLGTALAHDGHRVLLVDVDQQGNLTASFGLIPAQQKYTLATLMNAAVDDPDMVSELLPKTIIQPANVDLIPSNQKLANVITRLLAMKLTVNSYQQSDIPAECVLRSILEPLRPNYDYIIIDCGHTLDVLMTSALTAADYCIIPVQAHYLACEGVPVLMEQIAVIQRQLNPTLKIAGILLTMYQGRPNLCRSVKEAMQETYGTEVTVFNSLIEYAVVVAESPAHGMSVVDYKAACPAAISYCQLAKEVERLG